MAAACASNPSPTPDQAAASIALKPSDPVFLKTDLLGKTADTLDNLLGEAALVRREGAGEFRRYSLAKCGLIVILYPDDGGSVLRAIHLDAAAKSSEEEKPALDGCLAAGIK